MTDPKPSAKAYVDIVARGRALVLISGGTLAEPVGGQIILRAPRRYDVENDAGEVVGQVRTYRPGARMLARHYGVIPANALQVKVGKTRA